MDARLWTAAVVAAGCAWLTPAPAQAQIARQEFRIDSRHVMARAAPPRRSAYALPVLADWRPLPSDGLMRSWEFDGGMRVGFGRFSINPIARQRSGMERELMPTERRSSAVTGAGVRLPF